MADLVINSRANPTYGSVEIPNKYTPLLKVVLDPSDLANALKIINKRISVLSDANVFPKKLNLYVTMPPVLNVNTPAVVVVSSNRAEWIAEKFDAEATNYNATGYLDAQTLSKGLYLWYSPRRSGRRVFICVHYTEYHYYVEKLGQVPDVTIVGWKIPTAKNALDVVGFGASRFAALELAKKLGYHKAWVVDDNVVNINGFPNALKDIEDLLANNIWAIGFKAATLLKETGSLPNEVTLAAKTYDFGAKEAGLLQQVVLWDIDQLRNAGRTMSPCFLTSNEDVSFCNWMIKNRKDQRVITEFTVIKAAAGNDKNNPGTAEVEKRRTRMLAMFSGYEVDLKVRHDNQDVPLPQFVADVVLKLPTAQGQKASVVQARCAEQVMAAALLQWAAPDYLFDPYKDFPNNANDRVEQMTPAQI